MIPFNIPNTYTLYRPEVKPVKTESQGLKDKIKYGEMGV